MVRDIDAREWLRANEHTKLAEQIDSIMARWAKSGKRTRRNWWDVLAGGPNGEPRKVAGVTFPVLAAARKRKGLPSVSHGLERRRGEVAPEPADVTRWSGTPKKNRDRDGKQRRAKLNVKSKALSSLASEEPVKQGSEGVELRIKNFAQLDSVKVPLRDLVVLVGPQATGKSLVLEILKLALDRGRIVAALKQYGYRWENLEQFNALYFGGGFEKAWSTRTEVSIGNTALTPEAIVNARTRKTEDAVFYIPAHRTLAIGEGWPRSFVQYQVETPYVARSFSESLLTSLSQGLVGKGKIFPPDRKLKEVFRKLIDKAVFHGATLKLDTLGMRKQFMLEYAKSEARLPFMAWTAGQREFTPMLLGLYHLLPAGGPTKKKGIQWAVLEEPEMGLHPKAIVAVMAVVLDLLARGYKVALSTHSPTVLEVVWGMSRLKGKQGGAAELCKMMGLPAGNKDVLKTASRALERSYGVVYLEHNAAGRVESKDISGLNPGDPIEGEWGGLATFSTKVTEAIAASRNTGS